MNERRAPYILGLVRDGMGQGGIDEGLKLSKGLRVGSIEMPAGAGDVWLENSVRYSTPIGAGGSDVVGQSLASGSWASVNLLSIVWDTDDCLDFARSYSQMVINTDGVYSIFGYGLFAANATGVRGIGLLKNGSIPGSSVMIAAQNMAALSVAQHIAVNATWQFDEGDTLELQAYQSSGGALNLDFSLFSAVRMV